MKNKKQKIEEIKTTNEFYQALRSRVANLFNCYDCTGYFEGMSEQQKKIIFQFGCGVLSQVYNPIQKRYTKKARRKVEKTIKTYEDNLAYFVNKYRAMYVRIEELEEKLKQMGVA